MVRSDPVSDRLLYLPMVGIALAAAALVGRLATTAVRPALPVCIGAALLSLALLTWHRNTQYQSELALWQDAALKNPSNPRAHFNLGVVYEAAGEFERAESEYRVALSLRPGLGPAAMGLERVRLEREGEVSP
jgi:Flp pilus assembly protein TadD